MTIWNLHRHGGPILRSRAEGTADALVVREGLFEFQKIAVELPGHCTRGIEALSHWIALYDANLRWADWAVGEAVGSLHEAGVFSETILIVTSDHGEALGYLD